MVARESGACFVCALDICSIGDGLGTISSIMAVKCGNWFHQLTCYISFPHLYDVHRVVNENEMFHLI